MSTADRFKQVAEAYRMALMEHAPAICGQLDDRMVAAGNRWVCSDTVINVNRMMSAKDIADEFGIEAYNVMDWSRRHPDLIPKTKQGGRVFFNLGDVLRYRAMSGR